VTTSAAPGGRELAGAAVLCALMALALHPGLADGSATPWVHDLRTHHDPWRAWAASVWMRGEVPWWSAGAGGGFPLLAAGEGGFLYPPTMLLYAVVQDARALGWSLAGHAAWAGLGLHVYLRAAGRTPAAARLGALAWTGSAWMASHALYPGMHAAWAWLPWALAATVCGHGPLLALATAMAGLAGHPQGAAFGGLVVGVHALTTRGGPLGFARWGGWALLGALVAAPQLGATWALAGDGLRAGGLSSAEAREGAWPLAELPRLLVPSWMGAERPGDVPVSYEHRGGVYLGMGASSWEVTGYLGIAAGLLACLGAVRGDRTARGWAALGVAGVFVALGGPAWDALRHLPGLGGFRMPARAMLVPCLAVPVLAAHGWDALGARADAFRAAGRTVARLAGVAWLGTALGAAGLRAARPHGLEAALVARAARPTRAVPPDSDPLRAASTPPLPPRPNPAARARRVLDQAEAVLDPLGPDVLRAVGALAGTAALLGTGPVVAGVGMPLLVAADALGTSRGWLGGVAPDATRRAPGWLPAVRDSASRARGGIARVAVLDRRGPVAREASMAAASLNLLHGTREVFVPTPLRRPRHEALLAASGLGLWPTGAAAHARYEAGRDVARRMAVRWVVRQESGASVTVEEDPAALPRARVHACARGVSGAVEAWERLPSTVLSEVLVETPTWPGSIPACSAGVVAPVPAQVVVDADARVVLSATGPGWLVLADSWDEGWHATIDGTATPVARADLDLRAVWLPAGAHHVTFDYDPGWPARALPWCAGVLLGLVAACLGRARSALAAW
jgi:hypothetical protein